MQVLLKPIEADIVTAESSEQALRAAQDDLDHIALILLDVQIPIMDGFEVARLPSSPGRLWHSPEEFALSAVTGRDQRPVRQE